ncbi:Ni/Fe-hydrogenase, b-type cytochrome subunit [Campylobacter sp. 2018MI13]|uniref:Ni/Fe-hydrogenase, b-type cytochrome subunit n=1 Tax=Campylobacter sp. 2018MI13 TaxID=2836737 RepID=UPI001BDA996E|nr:Ni/Fe-hydrogenase, b-type cytochrome subunit [Campylobacter sp. 2018MI13]MBT0882568.1 Ni/Fe-hydrogenase, b-type cytochrome subunit [Campylobacter sp. 2018MI13]
MKHYEFSIGLRATHWLRALAILALCISGFYIASVFIAPDKSTEPNLFMQAKFRFVHNVAGFVLLACFIFKLYLFIFDKLSKKERVSIKDCFSLRVWIEQIKFYLFLGKHPHLKGVYNPLQFVSYFFFYIVLALLIITGFVLYINVYHEGFAGAITPFVKPFEAMFGGLANVRIIHHILTWVTMIFVGVHIYMAVFNAIKGKDGAMDAIFSGYKYK